jgi:hypothetical protein
VPDREIGVRRCFAVIDGSLGNAEGGRRWHRAVRPGVAVRFDHAAKANRPAFLLCQGFVTLSAVVPGRERSVPPACAAVPARSPWPRDCCAPSALSGLLLDAWYRRGSLIRTALRLGHEVIGQATPPCSRCPHRASPEGAAGSMARALMPTRLQHCPPRPLPAMAGPAAPCRPRFLKAVVRGCELAKGSG